MRRMAPTDQSPIAGDRVVVFLAEAVLGDPERHGLAAMVDIPRLAAEADEMLASFAGQADAGVIAGDRPDEVDADAAFCQPSDGGLADLDAFGVEQVELRAGLGLGQRAELGHPLDVGRRLRLDLERSVLHVGVDGGRRKPEAAVGMRVVGVSEHRARQQRAASAKLDAWRVGDDPHLQAAEGEIELRFRRVVRCVSGVATGDTDEKRQHCAGQASAERGRRRERANGEQAREHRSPPGDAVLR